jgi:preprotein translocase SecE subunit
MKNIRRFFDERMNELRNVTWPTRKHATHSMILVLVIVLLSGIMLGVMDWVLKQGIYSIIT